MNPNSAVINYNTVRNFAYTSGRVSPASCGEKGGSGTPVLEPEIIAVTKPPGIDTADQQPAGAASHQENAEDVKDPERVQTILISEHDGEQRPRATDPDIPAKERELPRVAEYQSARPPLDLLAGPFSEDYITSLKDAIRSSAKNQLVKKRRPRHAQLDIRKTQRILGDIR